MKLFTEEQFQSMSENEKLIAKIAGQIAHKNKKEWKRAYNVYCIMEM